MTSPYYCGVAAFTTCATAAIYVFNYTASVTTTLYANTLVTSDAAGVVMDAKAVTATELNAVPDAPTPLGVKTNTVSLTHAVPAALT